MNSYNKDLPQQALQNTTKQNGQNSNFQTNEKGSNDRLTKQLNSALKNIEEDFDNRFGKNRKEK